jgi:dipeptidyl-peptidase-4
MNRSQQAQVTYEFSNKTLVKISEAKNDQWVECVPGTPAALTSGELLTVHETPQMRSLCINDRVLTDRQISGLISHDEAGIIAGVFNEPWQHEIVRFNFDGTQISLSEPHGYAMAIADEDLSVVVQSNFVEPVSHYFIKRDDQIIFEVASNSQLIDLNIEIEIGTVTDRKLPYAVIWPEGHDRGSHQLPVIVSIYGGPHHAVVAASKKAFASDQWLANQGYAVIALDNAGAPGRSPAWEHEVFGNLADPVLADQVAGLQALFEMFPADLDPARVGIHGWSFGGYLSALAVLDRPDVYASAWAGAPTIDWALYDTGYTERYMGTPQNNAEGYASTSLINKAHKLIRPLTLIHGMSDDNVLAAHSLQMSGALLAAGKAHNFLPLAGVSHMTPQANITQNLMLLMRDFFDSTLNVQR